MARRRRRYTGSRRRKRSYEKEVLIVIALLVGSSIIMTYYVYIIIAVVIALLVLAGYAVFKYVDIRNRRKETVSAASSINELLIIYGDSPTKFEHYVADIYRELGYRANVTTATGDCGKDIILKKDGKKYVVEVKLYKKTSLIDRPKIQKLHSAQNDEKADKAIFVTTSDFTAPAAAFAKKHKIELINGVELVKLIERAKNGSM